MVVPGLDVGWVATFPFMLSVTAVPLTSTVNPLGLTVYVNGIR